MKKQPTKKPPPPPPLSAKEQEREQLRLALKRANAREKEIRTLARALSRNVINADFVLELLAESLMRRAAFSGTPANPSAKSVEAGS